MGKLIFMFIKKVVRISQVRAFWSLLGIVVGLFSMQDTLAMRRKLFQERQAKPSYSYDMTVYRDGRIARDGMFNIALRQANRRHGDVTVGDVGAANALSLLFSEDLYSTPLFIANQITGGLEKRWVNSTVQATSVDLLVKYVRALCPENKLYTCNSYPPLVTHLAHQDIGRWASVAKKFESNQTGAQIPVAVAGGSYAERAYSAVPNPTCGAVVVAAGRRLLAPITTCIRKDSASSIGSTSSAISSTVSSVASSSLSMGKQKLPPIDSTEVAPLKDTVSPYAQAQLLRSGLEKKIIAAKKKSKRQPAFDPDPVNIAGQSLSMAGSIRPTTAVEKSRSSKSLVATRRAASDSKLDELGHKISRQATVADLTSLDDDEEEEVDLLATTEGTVVDLTVLDDDAKEVDLNAMLTGQELDYTQPDWDAIDQGIKVLEQHVLSQSVPLGGKPF